MGLHRDQDAVAAADDRRAAAILMARVWLEIRYLAGPVRREEPDTSVDADLDRIRFLANLCHNLPGVARPPVRGKSRRNAPRRRFVRAMAERPLAWAWNTAGPEEQAWIVEQLSQAGHRWVPPPPLPTARKGPR